MGDAARHATQTRADVRKGPDVLVVHRDACHPSFWPSNLRSIGLIINALISSPVRAKIQPVSVQQPIKTPHSTLAKVSFVNPLL